MIDRDELAAWLRLVATPGVGRDTARRLLAQFGSPEGVLGASTAARRPLTGEATATALATEPEGFAQLLAATRAWLAARPARPECATARGSMRRQSCPVGVTTACRRPTR